MRFIASCRRWAAGTWRASGFAALPGGEIENPDYFDEELIPITSKHYLYLSGTPFRAIASGEFIEEQIFNWTYSDEQREKEMWGDKPGNPYASLPKMVLLTYQLPAEITRVAEEGEFDEFDLNSFFEASVPGNDKSRVAEAVFKHHDEVQKWLDMLRDTSSPETYFQAAFRVQSPWTITNSDGLHPNHTEIIKKVCYVFDFSPNCALRKVADYSCQLNVDEGNPEKCVDDFIRFLPVFCYESGVMNQLNAADIHVSYRLS